MRGIALELALHLNTVTRILKRYETEGLVSALYDKPRSGQPRKITPAIEAQVTVLACSEPPAGHTRWTVKMITDKLIELKCLDSINDETIRGVLKKVNLSPGKSVSGVSGRQMASI
jgi:putative transposase